MYAIIRVDIPLSIITAEYETIVFGILKFLKSTLNSVITKIVNIVIIKVLTLVELFVPKNKKNQTKTITNLSRFV
jgi:hypothetical protein